MDSIKSAQLKRGIVFLIILCFALQGPVGLVEGKTVSEAASTVIPLKEEGPILRGLRLGEDPFEFHFLIQDGDQASSEEYLSLVKYFLTTLTTPDKDIWVNLAPNEENRIIPDDLSRTLMGHVLLEQDYLLKQISSSLMNPNHELGANFWKKVNSQLREAYGTFDLPVNTYNRVWILPNEAAVYEEDGEALILQASLKVMLEEDYKAISVVRSRAEAPSGDFLMKENKQIDTNDLNSISTKAWREVILPAINEEVNHGESFAALRQVYHSMILASWYKQAMEKSLLGEIYVDQHKVKGIDSEDHFFAGTVHQRYQKAIKEGAFNFIREEYDPISESLIPKHYFSGGFAVEKSDFAQLVNQPEALSPDLRMIYERIKELPFNEVVVRLNSATQGEETDRAQGGKTKTAKELAKLIEQGKVTMVEIEYEGDDYVTLDFRAETPRKRKPNEIYFNDLLSQADEMYEKYEHILLEVIEKEELERVFHQEPSLVRYPDDVKEQIIYIARNAPFLIAKDRLTLFKGGPFDHARRGDYRKNVKREWDSFVGKFGDVTTSATWHGEISIKFFGNQEEYPLEYYKEGIGGVDVLRLSRLKKAERILYPEKNYPAQDEKEEYRYWEEGRNAGLIYPSKELEKAYWSLAESEDVSILQIPIAKRYTDYSEDDEAEDQPAFNRSGEGGYNLYDLSDEEQDFKTKLIERIENEKWSDPSRKFRFANAMVRYSKKAYALRSVEEGWEEVLSPERVAAILQFKSDDIDLNAWEELFKKEEESYQKFVDYSIKGKPPIFNSYDIRTLVYEYLIPSRWVSHFLHQGVSKKIIMVAMEEWENPIEELKPFLEIKNELILDGVPPSMASLAAFNGEKFMKYWKEVLLPIRDELVSNEVWGVEKKYDDGTSKIFPLSRFWATYILLSFEDPDYWVNEGKEAVEAKLNEPGELKYAPEGKGKLVPWALYEVLVGKTKEVSAEAREFLDPRNAVEMALDEETAQYLEVRLNEYEAEMKEMGFNELFINFFITQFSNPLEWARNVRRNADQVKKLRTIQKKAENQKRNLDEVALEKAFFSVFHEAISSKKELEETMQLTHNAVLGKAMGARKFWRGIIYPSILEVRTAQTLVFFGILEKIILKKNYHPVYGSVEEDYVIEKEIDGQIKKIFLSPHNERKRRKIKEINTDEFGTIFGQDTPFVLSHFGSQEEDGKYYFKEDIVSLIDKPIPIGDDPNSARDLEYSEKRDIISSWRNSRPISIAVYQEWRRWELGQVITDAPFDVYAYENNEDLLPVLFKEFPEEISKKMKELGVDRRWKINTALNSFYDEADYESENFLAEVMALSLSGQSKLNDAMKTIKRMWQDPTEIIVKESDEEDDNAQLAKNPGGIDLNRAHLDLSVYGNREEIDIDPEELLRLREAVTGFVPVIVEIINRN